MSCFIVRMLPITPPDRPLPTSDDEAIYWLRAHGWTISCAGGGDEWLITGYKAGGKVKGAGNSLEEALLAVCEQAQQAYLTILS